MYVRKMVPFFWAARSSSKPDSHNRARDKKGSDYNDVEVGNKIEFDL